VQAAVGLQLGDLEPLPERLAPGTMLVLAGVSAVDPHEPATQRLIEWLRAGVAHPALLLCVCSGSVLAARAGLLAAANAPPITRTSRSCAGRSRAARVLDNRIFVEDGPVFTSAGVTAGIDLALHVIARQLGAPVAAEVARDLVVYLRRAGTDPALSPWLMHRNHLASGGAPRAGRRGARSVGRWTSAELSAVACTSSRNLTRLFAEHAHCSPLDYVQLMRFAVARS